MTDWKGPDWENRIADHAADKYGLPWTRRNKSGNRDLLDITGCLPDGWLIGGKAVGPRAEKVRDNGMSALSQRLSEAMNQCDRAMISLAARYERNADDVRLYEGPIGDVIPVQIVQRVRHSVGQAYAVMTYDRLLRVVQLRCEKEARQ